VLVICALDSFAVFLCALRVIGGVFNGRCREVSNQYQMPLDNGHGEACSIAGMAKRSVLYAIKLPGLVEGDEYT